MTPAYEMRAARALRLFCPVEPPTLIAMFAGDESALEQDKNLASMLSIIRSGDALGNFGIYKSVIEVSPGYELFTPSPGATPTLGESGSPSVSPTAILTIYIADEALPEAVDRAIAALMKAHPWEVPVMEITGTFLLLRGAR